MKKKNKAAAQDWQQDQKEEREVNENFSEDLERLRYAGCKRNNMPDPDTFRKAGYLNAAQKIRQALGLLEDAYYEVTARVG